MGQGISIIIPTHNGGQVFSKCLEMIGQQDYSGQIQLIIVDSGSTDGTVELAERAGAFVKRIHRKKFHHARTRNEGKSRLIALYNEVWNDKTKKKSFTNDLNCTRTSHLP